jgi:hypothetical protein
MYIILTNLGKNIRGYNQQINDSREEYLDIKQQVRYKQKTLLSK